MNDLFGGYTRGFLIPTQVWVWYKIYTQTWVWVRVWLKYEDSGVGLVKLYPHPMGAGAIGSLAEVKVAGNFTANVLDIKFA